MSELVTLSTPLIHTATGDTPVYLNQISKYVPGVSIGSIVSAEILKTFGFEIAPSAPIGTPVVPPALGKRVLENAKSVALGKVERARAVALSDFKVDISSTVQVVVDIAKQISVVREKRVEATLFAQEGTKIVFRDNLNVIHELSADDMLYVCEAVIERYDEVYAKYWAAKDAIVAATTVEEIPTV